MASVSALINRMRYWCAVANMGYSQSDRWNFNPSGGNCDCSSLVIHCLKEAGFDTGTATYTGNLSDNLTRHGWTRLPANGNPQPGDILLNDVHHVALYLGGGKLAQASISERGTAYGAAATRLAAKPISGATTATRGTATSATATAATPAPRPPAHWRWTATWVPPPSASGRP